MAVVDLDLKDHIGITVWNLHWSKIWHVSSNFVTTSEGRLVVVVLAAGHTIAALG